MAKKFVRLKDAGSMFHNIETGEDISGPGAKEMRVTDKLLRGIKGGVLVELSDLDEAKKWNKQKGVDTPITIEEGAQKAKTAKELKDELLDNIEKAETEEAVDALIADQSDKQILKAGAAKIKELKDKK